MSTRWSSSSLLPFEDNPKAIIRASNVAKRSAAHLVGHAQAPSSPPQQVTPSLPLAVEPPPFSTPPQFKVTPFYPPNSLPSPLLRPPPTHPAMSAQANDDKPDCLQMLMETQHNQLLQAQQDWAAHQTSPESHCAAASTSSDRVDLQRFCTADGPLYSGPFHDVDHFLNWVNATQIFFASKGVSHDTDKIRIVGSLIRKVNILAFYSNRVDFLSQLSWAAFKLELFDFTLPPLWHSTLRDQLRDLRLRDNKSFTSFSTRARTIQTLVNFDSNSANLGEERPVTISDLELAETVVYGLPAELKALVKNHEVLLKRPFKYTDFESRTQLFYHRLPRKNVLARRPAGGLTQSTSAPVTCMSRNKTIWRVHAFLDSQGRCHHSKKRCGSVPNSCPSSLNRAYVEVPSAFITPPKPSDYKPPKAWAPSSFGASKPTQAPAGRAPAKASVSAIEKDSVCPDLDAASVAAIDKELRLTREEQYVSPPPSDWIILLFQCGDISLRALVDTGSEINLISDSAVQRVNLLLCPLLRPTTVHLALDNNSSTPLLLEYFVSTNFVHLPSSLPFYEISLRVGPIKVHYDIILGTPFLSCFNLSVSVSSQCLKFEDSSHLMFDFCRRAAMNTPSVSIASLAASEQYEAVAQRILKDFEDLVPSDIPAVSDEAEKEGLFTDGTFPDKLQNSDSRVQHKIILTYPDAMINEQQYSYPQKHLTSWRTLLDQHVEAGRLRHSSSQYAFPSMIIPKKDPSALPRWVCNYCVLNSFTVKDRSPLPNVDELIRTISSGKIFSILDQTSAFFQTRMRKANITLTAVKTPWGLYEWIVMPIGLTNAPATHQAQLEEALGELINNFCVVYLKDIVIFSDTPELHEQHVRIVLERLRHAHLYCSPKKTKLFQHKVKFLGHWVSANRIGADDKKITHILTWPSLQSPN
ncbi:hypothetical protein PCANC_24743 [Puccinia coronata f. sp. avenae]|uniref:Reverse transcriptase domain-containing protein n=1 Tax=Puccinia coronata f. sp. avenae TaxID=200324 RepID=A0A2N5TWV5_9BASI|nr:hypothetical protein PCANC_24743 [Puccinia coronata f. sp. avenae]